MADAALMDPSQIGQNITNSFLQGMDRGQQAKTQSALAAYVQNPSDKTAIEVARNNPALGMQLRDRQQQLQAARQAQEIKAKAAAGDPQALAQLAGIDFNAWSKMDDQQHKAIAERTKYIGQAALRISQMPESDRPAAWDQAVTQGSQYFPDLAQYKGQYSPQALQSAVDHAGLVMDLIQTTKPQVFDVAQGAGRYEQDPITRAVTTIIAPNAGDKPFGTPSATPTAGGIPHVASPEDAKKLPPGTQFMMPDGRIGTVPGGASGNAGGNFPKLNSYYGGQ